MATVAKDILTERGGGGFTAFADRWIFVFMAALFVVTVLVGFIPDSIGMVHAVDAGERPPLPVLLHVHAVLMGSWLLLLLAQTTLVATGRTGMHRQLGLAGAVIAPAMVVAGFMLIPALEVPLALAVRDGPAEMSAALAPKLAFALNIQLVQIRIGLVFGVLISLALAARKQDPELHKRLIILATVGALPAATDRMHWLPTTMPNSPLTVDLYMLVLLLPLFAWDLYRQKRIHRAYLIWASVYAPPTALVYLGWGTHWWRETALSLLGVQGL